VKRAWLEAVAGRRVSIVNVRTFERQPPEAQADECDLRDRGLARRHGSRGLSRSRRVVQSADIVPLPRRASSRPASGRCEKGASRARPSAVGWRSQQLLWVRRLQVRLSFAGVERSKRPSGISWPAAPRRRKSSLAGGPRASRDLEAGPVPSFSRRRHRPPEKNDASPQPPRRSGAIPYRILRVVFPE
jgi:hypothetical protein